MGRAGLEYAPSNTGNTASLAPADVKSDGIGAPIDPDLARVMAAWAALPPAIRRAVLALVGNFEEGRAR